MRRIFEPPRALGAQKGWQWLGALHGAERVKDSRQRQPKTVVKVPETCFVQVKSLLVHRHFRFSADGATSDQAPYPTARRN